MADWTKENLPPGLKLLKKRYGGSFKVRKYTKKEWPLMPGWQVVLNISQGFSAVHGHRTKSAAFAALEADVQRVARAVCKAARDAKEK